MSDKLAAWIAKEVKQRGWSYRELARQARISQSLISRTLAGDMPTSADFCIKVAQALNEPPEKALKLAGILPTSPASDDSPLQELMELARSLPPEDREELLKYARFRYQQRKDSDEKSFF